MLHIVSESCPTKIFLANPEMDRDLYREAFHLNDTELDLIAGLVPPGQMLIRKAPSSKKVQLNVDSVSHWMATNNSRDNLTKREYFERFGIPEGLRRLAQDHPFRPRTAAGALADQHPMIVRINDVGRAEAIDYRNFQYRPQEAENKYYLSRWAEIYFSRNRFTIERDQTNSLYFLNADVQRAVIEQERKNSVIQTYARDSMLPFVDIEVKNVVLGDLRQSPYSARIEFEKVYTNPADHSEMKRERWTATVTYVFRENVKNNELAVNPLGLTIVRFRADRAFS
jgi:type IV secretory pathway TrbF-like protein